MSQSRRDFLKVSAAGVVALSRGAYAFGVPAAPKGEIDVRLTAGAARFAPQASVRWQSLAGMSGETILLDPTKAYQEVLGVGAALTEAACYMFNQLPPQVREQLFHELYHPSEMGFGVCRTCIGSSDYSTVAYSQWLSLPRSPTVTRRFPVSLQVVFMFNPYSCPEIAWHVSWRILCTVGINLLAF